MGKRKSTSTKHRQNPNSPQIASPSTIAGINGKITAVRLRLMGLSYEAIGDRLGICKSAAHKRVKTALQEMVVELDESTEELRQLELERLDRMQLALWPAALRGDVSAVNAIMRIMGRRAALTGIDVPLEIDWRREAEAKGLEPSEVFEEMVGFFHERLTKVMTDD